MAEDRGVIARMLAGMDNPVEAQGPPSPFDTDPQRQRKYLAQRDWRGISNAVLGLPDLVNTVLNAGIRDVDYFTGGGLSGGTYDPYQFSMPSQDAANLAAATTGQEIIPAETMPPEVQQQGANREALYGMLPVNPEASLGVAAKDAAIILTPAYRRLAEQMASKGKAIESFHPVGGGNKLRMPFSDLTSTTRPTGGPMLADKPFSPEDFKVGSYLLPLYGDKSIAGQTVTHINDVPLTIEQKLGGGGRFMQENPGKLWASDQGKGTKVSGMVQKLEQESGQPVYATHVSMGAKGGDFAKHTARPLLQLTDQARISDAQAAAFDTRMTEAGVANWPGIKNVTDDWLGTASGGDRAKLAQTMELSSFQRDPAFADLGAVRKATTEPELMHEPMLTSGMTVGQFAPGAPMVTGAGTHESYPTDWLGQHLGNMGQVPFSVMFPDVLAGYLAKNPALADNLPGIGYSVERQIPAQKITPQWQDQAMQWWEVNR